MGFRRRLPLMYVFPSDVQTMYELPSVPFRRTVTLVFHLPVMWRSIHTRWLQCSSVNSDVCLLLYSSDFPTVLSLPAVELSCACVCSAVKDSCCRCHLPKNSWLGDTPSVHAVLLHAALVSCRFSPCLLQRVISVLMFFTAASANPFDSGL